MIGHHVDTKETINKTIKFAKSLGLHAANFTIAVPLEGSELFSIMHKYGTFDGNMRQLTVHTDNPPFVPFGLTKEYLTKMRRKAYIEFYTSPKTLLNLTKSIHSVYDVQRYFIGFKILLKLIKKYA